LIQEERYLLACYRYFELNPVRAGMVNVPGDYPWSIYECIGAGKPNALITPYRQYLNLSTTREDRLANYTGLFEIVIQVEELNHIRSATNGNHVLGSGRFQREIELALGKRTQPGRPGRPRKTT